MSASWLCELLLYYNNRKSKSPGLRDTMDSIRTTTSVATTKLHDKLKEK
jgi:hypothetical protein